MGTALSLAGRVRRGKRLPLGGSLQQEWGLLSKGVSLGGAEARVCGHISAGLCLVFWAPASEPHPTPATHCSSPAPRSSGRLTGSPLSHHLHTCIQPPQLNSEITPSPEERAETPPSSATAKSCIVVLMTSALFLHPFRIIYPSTFVNQEWHQGATRPSPLVLWEETVVSVCGEAGAATMDFPGPSPSLICLTPLWVSAHSIQPCVSPRSLTSICSLNKCVDTGLRGGSQRFSHCPKRRYRVRRRH